MARDESRATDYFGSGRFHTPSDSVSVTFCPARRPAPPRRRSAPAARARALAGATGDRPQLYQYHDIYRFGCQSPIETALSTAREIAAEARAFGSPPRAIDTTAAQP